jgi:MFS family permease
MGYCHVGYRIQLGRKWYSRIVSPTHQTRTNISYLAPVLRSVGIRDPLTITGLNAGLAAFNMIASLTFGVFSEYIGRRPMWIISNTGMGFGFCFIMGFAAAFANTGNTGFGLAVIPFIFIVYGFYDLAWIALNYTYVAEFMPYNLRTKGLALYITFNSRFISRYVDMDNS